MGFGNSSGQAESPLREWGDDWLGSVDQLQACFEDIGFEEVENGFVLVVLDVDGAAFKGHTFAADVKTDEDRIALDASGVALPHTIGGVEVYILGFAGHLIPGEEMQQNTVHATAGISSNSQSVKGNFNAGVF